MERVGLIGLGRMGHAMARRLLDAGFAVAVTNRTRARAEPLLADGAIWADTPAALLDCADIVLTILTDDQAVEQVYTGEYGLIRGDAAGKLFIEMSTIRTRTIQELLPQVEQAGARLLDAPVSGTLEPARRGELMAMVGGRAEDLERARPVLEPLTRRINHYGPSGSGTTMKLVLNMPMATFWISFAESLTMGERFGLDRAQMIETFLDSPVALPTLRAKAPLLLGAEHEVGFDVTGVRKDLLAMVSTGQQAGVPMAVGSAAMAVFAAATAAGYGERDLVFVVDYFANMVRDAFGDERPG